MSPAVDEEALAERLDDETRRERGVFFTPAPLVAQVLEAAARWIPEGKKLAVIDPACGAGAFLCAAQRRFPRAAWLGAELHAVTAAECARRVPGATVLEGDALGGDVLERLTAAVPKGAFELWVGNPPYNGTSPLLGTRAAWERACSWMPSRLELPPGTSLREDYVFFMLRASLELAARPGVLAFVTSSTLLDAFLYAPVREALLSRLTLREVVDLGGGAFRGTKVKTCITVWTSGVEPRAKVRFRSEGQAAAFVARAPEWRLRPVDGQAEALDARWRRAGEALTALVPISLPGLKTRFDELLVDDDEDELYRRVKAFLERGAGPTAKRLALGPRLRTKLEALQRAARGVAADRRCLRRFLRYRGPLEPGPTAFCYLDRRLIPRGDHRLHGAWDPHAEDVKLVFNVHELPIAARVYDEPGCVTAYRHSRFAPLHVPSLVLEAGPGATRGSEPLGVPVVNLSARGRELARALGSPRKVFEAIARFINSDEVQRVWAPQFGTSRILPIPIDELTA